MSQPKLFSIGASVSVSSFFSLVILSSLIKAKFDFSGSQNFFAQLKVKKSSELLFMYVVASGGPVNM